MLCAKYCSNISHKLTHLLKPIWLNVHSSFPIPCFTIKISLTDVIALTTKCFLTAKYFNLPNYTFRAYISDPTICQSR